MDYETTINTLFDLLSQANKADHESGEGWQRQEDASSKNYYGDLQRAIENIAGKEIVHHWSVTGEVLMGLANRNPVMYGRKRP